MWHANQKVALIGIAVKQACSCATVGSVEKVNGRKSNDIRMKTPRVRIAPSAMWPLVSSFWSGAVSICAHEKMQSEATVKAKFYQLS